MKWKAMIHPKTSNKKLFCMQKNCQFSFVAVLEQVLCQYLQKDHPDGSDAI